MSTPLNNLVPPVFVDPAMQSAEELMDLLKVTTPAGLTSFEDPELSVAGSLQVDIDVHHNGNPLTI